MEGSLFGAIPDVLDDQKSVRNLCNSCFSVAAALFKLSTEEYQLCESSRGEWEEESSSSVTLMKLRD